MRTIAVAAILVGVALFASSGRSADAPRTGPCSGVAPALQEKAISALRTAMKESKDFEKVHAAEALIWTGHADGVKDYYLDEDRTAGSKPRYRIGIWRTLYRLHAGEPAKQLYYLKRIVGVFSDPSAVDHNTAAETLGKLKYAERTARVLELAKPDAGELAVSGRWILANSGRADDEARLAECLGWKDPKDRAYAAYAVRYLAKIRPATLKALEQLAAKEPADGEVRYCVLGALYTHSPADARFAVRKELLKFAAEGSTDQRFDVCMALANAPVEEMVPTLEKLLDRKPADERTGAAYVLLRMGAPHDPADPNH